MSPPPWTVGRLLGQQLLDRPWKSSMGDDDGDDQKSQGPDLASNETATKPDACESGYARSRTLTYRPGIIRRWVSYIYISNRVDKSFPHAHPPRTSSNVI